MYLMNEAKFFLNSYSRNWLEIDKPFAQSEHYWLVLPNDSALPVLQGKCYGESVTDSRIGNSNQLNSNGLSPLAKLSETH